MMYFHRLCSDHRVRGCVWAGLCLFRPVFDCGCALKGCFHANASANDRACGSCDDDPCLCRGLDACAVGCASASARSLLSYGLICVCPYFWRIIVEGKRNVVMSMKQIINIITFILY